MHVLVLDTSGRDRDLAAGLIEVVGSDAASAEEKRECIDLLSRYAMDGWAIAADPASPLGQLAASTARAAHAAFVPLVPVPSHPRQQLTRLSHGRLSS